MREFIRKINYNSILVRYLFFVCLIYPPFVFFAFINETFRLSAFVLLLVLLIIKLFFQKIKINNFARNVFLLTLLIIYCGSSININYNTEGLRSSIGYSLILILSYLIYLNTNSNSNFRDFICKNYIRLFNFISISIIINCIINLFTGEFNFLTPYFPSVFSYNYSASIFGLSFRKDILDINISRNFWFFIEPVYTVPFFLINIFMIGPCKIMKNKYFVISNIVSGILSFSYFFFIGYLILFLLKNKPYVLLFLIIISSIPLIYLNFDYEGASIISSSSASDRLLRIDFAFEILSKFSPTKIFFGNGYLFSQSLEMGVSSGLLSSFIEGGLVGLILPLFLAIYYAKFNKMLFCIVFLSLLTIEPYKMPLFWIAIIIAGKLISINDEVK